MNIETLVKDKIAEVLQHSKKYKYDWNESTYEDTQWLSIDSRGNLGEKIVASILRGSGYEVEGDDGKTDAERGYDLIANGVKLEIKLATITRSSGGFQHENLHPQRSFDAILFIDIAPDQIFLTAVKKKDVIWSLKGADKKTEPGKKPKKALHRRSNGDYKCDFTIKHIQAKDIPKFRYFETDEIKTTEDFLNIYKHVETKD